MSPTMTPRAQQGTTTPTAAQQGQADAPPAAPQPQPKPAQQQGSQQPLFRDWASI